MKLYSNVVRIQNELKEVGKDNDCPLALTDLESFDQLHYNGVEALDIAIEKLGINPNSNILEIGAGIVRYVLMRSGCAGAC